MTTITGQATTSIISPRWRFIATGHAPQARTTRIGLGNTDRASYNPADQNTRECLLLASVRRTAVATTRRWQSCSPEWYTPAWTERNPVYLAPL